jgi:hypothetical protein
LRADSGAKLKPTPTLGRDWLEIETGNATCSASVRLEGRCCFVGFRSVASRDDAGQSITCGRGTTKLCCGEEDGQLCGRTIHCRCEDPGDGGVVAMAVEPVPDDAGAAWIDPLRPQ